jgi:hypothetical protein
VIFEEGPLRSTRFPCWLRMKIMSQQASAAARYVPSLVSWVRQMMSTNGDADGRSSYSKVIGVACTAKPPSWSNRSWIGWIVGTRDVLRSGYA